jgi:Domain of unknown function (DUF4157)
MFAPKVAKAQTKVSEGQTGKEGAERAIRRPRSFPAGAAWDFGTTSIHARDHSVPPAVVRSDDIWQPKLAIGPVDDPLEREADRVAYHVMRMPDPQVSVTPMRVQINRKCAACEEEDKAQKLQTKPAQATARASGEAPTIVHQVLSEPGAPLAKTTRSFFEPRLGFDLSRVRIHTEERAAASVAAIGALGYTAGQHIIFGAGQYQPETPTGRRLLAHELAHVMQQSVQQASTAQQTGAATTAVKKPIAERTKAIETLSDDILAFQKLHTSG